ncbi:hypothetical protein [Mycobacterium sp.]|uniref:hypothetical protein n=1 Tax=Mycobacterium sp. TaxID=1785 RepID=UPI003BA858CE
MSLQRVIPAIAGGLLAVTVLASGCSNTIDGRPTSSSGSGPTEPSFPSPRSKTSPPTAIAPTPANPTTPAGTIPLEPDHNGYVFIETKSGKTRCQINKNSVGCEAPFTNSPMQDGEHANGVSITAGGSVQWVLGNLGAIPTVTIDYKTYDAQGWIIAATTDGTRFTNNRTGHGMYVSIDKVNTF